MILYLKNIKNTNTLKISMLTPMYGKTKSLAKNFSEKQSHANFKHFRIEEFLELVPKT